MAGLPFTKTAGKGLLFFLKHIILIFILNILAYYCFNGFFTKIFSNKFYFYTNKIINSKNLFMIILSIVFLSIKSIIYCITMNDENNGTNVSIFDYFGEINDRFFVVFVNVVVMIFLLTISTFLFVIPGIVLFSSMIYSIVFCAGITLNCKNKNNSQQTYNLNTALYRTLEITKGLKFKLSIYNTILISILVCILYFANFNVYSNYWFDSNIIIKLCIFDLFLIIVFEFGFTLDKMEEKEYDSIRSKEKSKKYEIDKNKTRIAKDTKLKELGESYIKKKIR